MSLSPEYRHKEYRHKEYRHKEYRQNGNKTSILAWPSHSSKDPKAVALLKGTDEVYVVAAETQLDLDLT